jgi:hypothetical protein
MPGKHARLSPSDWTRWGGAGCELAIYLDDCLRDRNDGEIPAEEGDYTVNEMLEIISDADGASVEDSLKASAKGTLAHAWGAQQLAGVQEDEVKIEESDLEAAGGDQLLANAQVYVDLMRQEMEGLPEHIEWGVERRVEIWYEPESRGAIDFWAHDSERRSLLVVDYKSGYEPVMAEDNGQLMIYGIALIDELGLWGSLVEKLTLVIIQPARSTQPRVWNPTMEEVGMWRDKINARALQQQKRTGTPRGIITEDGCRWCRHKDAATCMALEHETKDLLGLWDVSEIDDQRKSDLLSKAKPIRQFLDALEGYVREHAEDFPEWIEKSGNRRMSWGDKDEAAALLRENGLEFYEQKPRTPAAVKKDVDDVLWQSIEDQVVNVKRDKSTLVRRK